VVPLGPISSLFSALGAGLANLLLVVEHSEVVREPFDPALIDAQLQRLELMAVTRMNSMGVVEPNVSYEFEEDLRHVAQVHEVAVPFRQPASVDAAVLDELLDDFEARYEQYFGRGSAYREAGTEIIALRARALETRDPLDLSVLGGQVREVPVSGTREVYWPELADFVATPIVDGDKLTVGMQIDGPAVIEATNATILVRPAENGTVDGFGSLILSTERPLVPQAQASFATRSLAE
jgi:N-methylhydantoinase A